MRNHNTTLQGGAFSGTIRLAVWNKARIIPGVDSRFRRMDSYGALIDWAQYGVVDQSGAGTGWEIDHFQPVARQGTDDFGNLQPLHWLNNRKKSDSWPPFVEVPVKAA